MQIKDIDSIEVLENEIFKYVSRGGFKLEKALDVFDYDVKNKTIMDIYAVFCRGNFPTLIIISRKWSFTK